jgi:hypothetical protein
MMSDSNDPNVRNDPNITSANFNRTPLWTIAATAIVVIVVGLWVYGSEDYRTDGSMQVGSSHATENDATRPDEPNLPPGSRR